MNHVTSAKRALKELLIVQLPGKLAAADSSEGDGVQTPVPAEIHTADMKQLGAYPAIEMWASRSRPTADSLSQVYQHTIVVSFTLTGDDEERLTLMVERYMWAIRHVCRDTVLAPPVGTGPIDSGSEEYTLVGSGRAGFDEPFVKGGFIELFVTTVE